MTHFLVPFAFLLGAVAGGLLVRTWRSKAEGPGAPTSRQKLKLVVLTALATTVLLAATGYGIVRLKFRKTEMSQASTGKAVEDFRKAGVGKAAEGTPPGGVYTYHTKGYLKVSSALLGNEHRPLPKSIPAVLIPKGKCWDLTLRLYAQNHRGERYCKGDDGTLRLEGRWEKDEMFGIKTSTRQRCEPPLLIGAASVLTPGRAWKMDWKVVEHKTTMPVPISRPDLPLQVTYVGREDLEIEGKKIPAHRLRMAAKYGGGVKGTLDRDVWYSVDTGMMLKLNVKSLGTGLANMTIDRQYTLASLTPKQ